MRRWLIILILFSPVLAFTGSDMITGKATPQEMRDKVVEAAQYLSTTLE